MMDKGKDSFLLLFLTACFVMAVDGELSKADIERELRHLAVKRPDIPKARISSIMRALDSRSDAAELKKIISNELMLRKLYTLKFDEDCSTDKATSDSLVAPPEGRAQYIAWQETFINAKKPLCDPVKKFNRCVVDRTGAGKCGCQNGIRENTISRKSGALVKACVTNIGTSCGNLHPVYYDPLSLAKPNEIIIKRGSAAVDSVTIPVCKPEDNASPTGPRPPLPCSKLDYFFIGICYSLDPNGGVSRIQRYQELTDIARQKATLGPGDSCDLAKTEEYLRLKMLISHTASEASIRAIKDKELCNSDKLLYCGADSKCTCLEPTVLNPTTKICEIPAWKICGKRGSHQKLVEYFTDKLVANSVGTSLNEGLQNAPCVAQYTCVLASGEKIPGYSICACQGKKIGENCDIELGSYLINVTPIAYPVDVEDFAERLSIFTKLNENVLGIQKLMTLKGNDPCEKVNEDIVVEVIKFGIALSVNMPDGRDRKDYEEIINKASSVVSKSKGLCNLMDMHMCEDGVCKKDIAGVKNITKPPEPPVTTPTPDTDDDDDDDGIKKLTIDKGGRKVKSSGWNLLASATLLLILTTVTTAIGFTGLYTFICIYTVYN